MCTGSLRQLLRPGRLLKLYDERGIPRTMESERYEGQPDKLAAYCAFRVLVRPGPGERSVFPSRHSTCIVKTPTASSAVDFPPPWLSRHPWAEVAHDALTYMFPDASVSGAAAPCVVHGAAFMRPAS
jgi:hypothetical protein